MRLFNQHNATEVNIVTKTYGNLVLMTAICVVIFWIFMALRPASATFFPAASGDLGRFHGYGSPGVTAPPLTSPSRLREALDRLKTFKKRQEQKQ